QVWGSRPWRADNMDRDYDLLLSIFGFEKQWYARRNRKLHVEFVGHPLIDRYATPSVREVDQPATLLLLPGSRSGELKRHIPIMLGALPRIQQSLPNIRLVMVLPNQSLVELAQTFQLPPSLQVRVGGLADALSSA